MPALVLDQTTRLRGLRPSLTAAEWTVGHPRQSMKVPKTPPVAETEKDHRQPR